MISKMLQQLAKNYFVPVIPDCRNPDYKDVLNLPSMALDTRFPASMTDYFVSAASILLIRSSFAHSDRIHGRQEKYLPAYPARYVLASWVDRACPHIGAAVKHTYDHSNAQPENKSPDLLSRCPASREPPWLPGNWECLCRW